MPEPIYRMTAPGIYNGWMNVHAPTLPEALAKTRNALKVAGLVAPRITAYTIRTALHGNYLVDVADGSIHELKATRAPPS